MFRPRPEHRTQPGIDSPQTTRETLNRVVQLKGWDQLNSLIVGGVGFGNAESAIWMASLTSFPVLLSSSCRSFSRSFSRSRSGLAIIWLPPFGQATADSYYPSFQSSRALELSRTSRLRPRGSLPCFRPISLQFILGLGQCRLVQVPSISA